MWCDAVWCDDVQCKEGGLVSKESNPSVHIMLTSFSPPIHSSPCLPLLLYLLFSYLNAQKPSLIKLIVFAIYWFRVGYFRGVSIGTGAAVAATGSCDCIGPLTPCGRQRSFKCWLRHASSERLYVCRYDKSWWIYSVLAKCSVGWCHGCFIDSLFLHTTHIEGGGDEERGGCWSWGHRVSLWGRAFIAPRDRSRPSVDARCRVESL